MIFVNMSDENNPPGSLNNPPDIERVHEQCPVSLTHSDISGWTNNKPIQTTPSSPICTPENAALPKTPVLDRPRAISKCGGNLFLTFQPYLALFSGLLGYLLLHNIGPQIMQFQGVKMAGGLCE